MKKAIHKHPIPSNPLVADNLGNNVGHRDTLNRVVAVLQMLTELNISEEVSPEVGNGLYWVQLMLIDSVNYVSDALDTKTTHN